MKVLIADALSASSVAALQALGADVTVQANARAEQLPELIGAHTVLVVRSTKVTAETIAAGPALSLIIRAGAGVNNIDLAAASSRGIHVANCPGKNMDAVAELTLGLLIAADRRIVDASCDLRAGRWRKKKYADASGLKGRTLGVLGLGAIGLCVARLASSLGMRILGWSRSLTPERAKALGIAYCETPLELARRSDAVTVHLASCAETRGLCDQNFFAAMKDDAIFLNTSRGCLIDSAALRSAIQNKNLRVGLDVFAAEPAGSDDDFDQRELAESVTCTPHIGASTRQAAEAIAEEVVAIARAYKETGNAINVINIRAKSLATSTLVVRHYNHVGVLASVLAGLRRENINIEEMENAVFEGSAAAICTLKIDGHPCAEALDAMRDHPSIIQISLL